MTCAECSGRGRKTETSCPVRHGNMEVRVGEEEKRG